MMMRMNWKAFVAFGALNALALTLGGLFTGPGVQSTWYAGLEQAPWIPPGGVFGLAWTVVMLCLAGFMGQVGAKSKRKRRVFLWYALQWVLNVLWNPLFFHFHRADLALIDMVLLLVSVLMLWRFSKRSGWWLLPYLTWLVIATSLNLWVVLFNA